jgi:hypothetical protein
LLPLLRLFPLAPATSSFPHLRLTRIIVKCIKKNG